MTEFPIARARCPAHTLRVTTGFGSVASTLGYATSAVVATSTLRSMIYPSAVGPNMMPVFVGPELFTFENTSSRIQSEDPTVGTF